MKNLLFPIAFSMCLSTSATTQPVKNPVLDDSIQRSAEILIEKDPDLDQATAITFPSSYSGSITINVNHLDG